MNIFISLPMRGLSMEKIKCRMELAEAAIALDEQTPVKFVECEDRPEPVGNRIDDILTDVTEQICDGYCKWPDVYQINYADRPEEGQEAMMAQKCRYCPLTEL